MWRFCGRHHRRLVDTAVERYGRLGILVNNAGIIGVGPVENLTASDYETAVQVMALAPMQLPYAMAKFAAVGFSEGLRAELGSHPVAVTTIVPGLMRTGSHT